VQILLVAPQPADREEIVATLGHSGHVVLVVGTAAQVTARLAQGNLELVVLDLASPDTRRFLRKYVAHRGATPVVCIADRRQPEASAEALRLGVADIVGRPVRQDDVLAAMASAARASSCPGGVQRAFQLLDDLPGPGLKVEGVGHGTS